MELRYGIVFTTGFSILVLEILASRLISPVYGNTIFVWSSIIGITIASLALGYWLGGKHAKKSLSLPIFIGGIGIGLTLLSKEIIMITTATGIEIGSFLSSTMLLFLPLTALGMVSPMIIDRLRQSAGKASGNVFAVGTVGSFFGAMITGFIFIPNIPVSYTIIGTSLGLVLLATALHTTNIRLKTIEASAVISAFAIATLLIPAQISDNEVWAIVEEKETLYSNVKVIDTKHHRILTVDNSVQSMTEKGHNESSIGFIQYSTIPYFYKSNIDDVLIIGLGSGSVTHEYIQRGADVDVVEIDGQLYDIVNRHFDIQGNIYIGDGRYFLNTTEKNYDVIIVDVSTSDSYPVHLFTKEAFETMQSRLAENGILLIHQSGIGDSDRIQSYHDTLDSVFNDVNHISFDTDDNVTKMQLFLASSKLVLDFDKIKSMYPMTEGENFTNVLINKNYENQNNGIIITDDYNPLDLMQHEVANEWRSAIWQRGY